MSEKIRMDGNTIHDLAVAYAQAKLIKAQQDNPELDGDDSEIRDLIKNYYHAAIQIISEAPEVEVHS